MSTNDLCVSVLECTATLLPSVTPAGEPPLEWRQPGLSHRGARNVCAAARQGRVQGRAGFAAGLCTGHAADLMNLLKLRGIGPAAGCSATTMWRRLLAWCRRLAGRRQTPTQCAADANSASAAGFPLCRALLAAMRCTVAACQLQLPRLGDWLSLRAPGFARLSADDGHSSGLQLIIDRRSGGDSAA